MNPVPIAPTFADDTDMTVAVNVGGPAEYPEKLNDLGAAPLVASSPFREKINLFVKRLQQSVTGDRSRDWGAYEIVLRAFDAMQSTIARHKLAAYPPDVVIEIARNSCQTLEFDRAAEMIELGYRKAAERLAHTALSLGV